MFQLEDCIAYITSRGAKTLAERLEDRFTGSGVSRVQWIAMYYVERCPFITQKQLAERMNLKESTVVRLLDRMEKDDMLHRTCSETDRRVRYLELTPKGRELSGALSVRAEQFKDDAILGISEEELEIFKKVLNQMLDNTEEG